MNMNFFKKNKAEVNDFENEQEETDMKEKKGVSAWVIGGAVAVVGGIASLASYAWNKHKKGSGYSEISPAEDVFEEEETEAEDVFEEEE